MSGAGFFGIVVFTIFAALVSETAGYIMKAFPSKLNAFVFAILRLTNYSQMLMVMSYNFWIICILVLSQAIFHFMYSVLLAKKNSK